MDLDENSNETPHVVRKTSSNVSNQGKRKNRTKRK